MSDKIQSQHLARKAVRYVRRSSAFQVLHNQESQKLQYAMQARLRDLGFTNIEVIDEDLGRSVSGTQARSGGSNAWWRKSVWDASARLPRERYRTLVQSATEGGGGRRA
jgi:hypothetical protein